MFLVVQPQNECVNWAMFFILCLRRRYAATAAATAATQSFTYVFTPSTRTRLFVFEGRLDLMRASVCERDAFFEYHGTMIYDGDFSDKLFIHFFQIF